MTLPADLCADLAFVNGHILTLDPEHSRARAVAVKDGNILRVGADEHIREVIGTRTQVEDLDGRTLLPGLIDSHMHPGGVWGAYLVRGIACGPHFGSVEEMLKAVRDKADATAPGEWILGHGLDDVRLGRYPRLDELDQAAPSHPLYIQRRDAHIAVVNSQALRAARITRDTPDPPHGKIDRDEHGAPTGILRENAKNLVASLMPPFGLEELYEGLQRVFAECLKYGLTSIHASMVSPVEFRALQRLKREGKLAVRTAVHLSGREEAMVNGAIAMGMETPFGDDWLKVTAVEWVLDTSTSGRTAAYYRPYVDEPENIGMLLYDQDDITRRVWEAHRAGLRVGLDGVGDRGIDRALDAIAHAVEKAPRNNHRHRIEHCCCVPPAVRTRLKDLRVVDASATAFLHDLGDAYKANRGEQEMQHMWPHRSLIDEGIPAPGHSDASVCSPNPWLGIYALVTRKTTSGDILCAGEAISPIEAIRAYTIDGAYAAWEESIKGTVTPGKLADLVIVDRDPLTIPPEQLKKTTTVMTVVNGKIAYRAR